MEEATDPRKSPKTIPIVTSREDPVVVKSEIVDMFSKETDNPKYSFETAAPKPSDTEGVINNAVKPQVEEKNSETEPRTTPVYANVLPVANSVGSGKEVVVGNIVVTDKEHVERLMYETVEEGVSKAVAELTLEQTEEHVVPDSVERVQPEHESLDVLHHQGTDADRNDTAIKDPVRVDEEQMDVDPSSTKTDLVSSAVDGREMGEEEVMRKDDITESKEEDVIDKTWKSGDFNLPPSDDEENYILEPAPEVIVELYQKLDEGNILDLEWTCLGRRTPDEGGEKMEVEEIIENDQEEKVNQPVEEDPTEFDFDIDAMIQNKITPRRIPGFDPKGSGSAKKRVAKMDKVINDIRRFTKINEEMVKTGDTALPPLQTDLEMTPQRPLGKFHIRRDLHQ